MLLVQESVATADGKLIFSIAGPVADKTFNRERRRLAGGMWCLRAMEAPLRMLATIAALRFAVQRCGYSGISSAMCLSEAELTRSRNVADR